MAGWLMSFKSGSELGQGTNRILKKNYDSTPHLKLKILGVELFTNFLKCWLVYVLVIFQMQFSSQILILKTLRRYVVNDYSEFPFSRPPQSY